MTVFTTHALNILHCNRHGSAIMVHFVLELHGIIKIKPRVTTGHMSDNRELPDANLSTETDSLLEMQRRPLLKRMCTSWRTVLILAALTAIGTFLRLYHLDYNSIWLDEGATYEISRHTLSHIWKVVADGEFNPPLFFWLEHFMLIPGNNEISLRLLPALIGTCTIPLVYLIGKEILDDNTGLASAAFITFSPFHILYSQDGRAYTTVLFFFTLALYFFLRALKSRSLRHWAAFGLFSALSFYTHFYIAIPLIIIVLYGLITESLSVKKTADSIRNLLTGVFLSLVISLPLIIITVPLIIRRTAAPPPYGIQGLPIVTTTLNQMLNESSWLTGFLLLLSLWGVFNLWRKERKSAALLLICIAVPLTVSIPLSLRMPLHPRCLIFLITFFALALSCAFAPLFTWKKWTLYIVIVLLCILNAFTLINYYSHYSTEDWRGATRYFSEISHQDDAIVFVPDYMCLPFNFYYRGSAAHFHTLKGYRESDFNDLVFSLTEERIFFIVTSDIFSMDPHGEAVQWMKSNAVYAGERRGIHVFVYDRNSR